MFPPRRCLRPFPAGGGEGERRAVSSGLPRLALVASAMRGVTAPSLRVRAGRVAIAGREGKRVDPRLPVPCRFGEEAVGHITNMVCNVKRKVPDCGLSRVKGAGDGAEKAWLLPHVIPAKPGTRAPVFRA